MSSKTARVGAGSGEVPGRTDEHRGFALRIQPGILVQSTQQVCRGARGDSELTREKGGTWSTVRVVCDRDPTYATSEPAHARVAV
jgi:hypothetical protein